MTIKNRFYNWRYKVKRLRRKGCKNVGLIRYLYGMEIVTKYDWEKPSVYVSRKYVSDYLMLKK